MSGNAAINVGGLTSYMPGQEFDLGMPVIQGGLTKQQIWRAFSDVARDSSNRVSQWDSWDGSPASQASDTKKPIYTPNRFAADFPGLVFDGAAQVLPTPHVLPATGYIVSAFQTPAVFGADGFYLGRLVSATERLLLGIRNVSGTWKIAATLGNVSAGVFNGGTLAPSTRYVMGLTLEATAKLRLNKVQVITSSTWASSGGAIPAQPVAIGAQWDGSAFSNYGKGDLGVVGVYSGTPTTTDCDVLDTSAGALIGVSI